MNQMKKLSKITISIMKITKQNLKKIMDVVKLKPSFSFQKFGNLWFAASPVWR